mmetsp:Transcript_11929/g.36774  ORF Transcript_11929/g.36774 Transcript_11929/m.36774 type:complete len:213 (-) Transcript_11929:119-757(-)
MRREAVEGVLDLRHAPGVGGAEGSQVLCDHRVVRLDCNISVDGALPGHELEGVARAWAAPELRVRIQAQQVRQVPHVRELEDAGEPEAAHAAVADTKRSQTPARPVRGRRRVRRELVRNIPGAEPEPRPVAERLQARAQGVASPLVEDDDVVAARPSARPGERREVAQHGLGRGGVPDVREERDGGVRRARRRREPEQPDRPDAIPAPHRCP